MHTSRLHNRIYTTQIKVFYQGSCGGLSIANEPWANENTIRLECEFNYLLIIKYTLTLGNGIAL